jgi:hypothetical protein
LKNLVVDMPARWSKWKTAHTQRQTGWTNVLFTAVQIAVVVIWLYETVRFQTGCGLPMSGARFFAFTPLTSIQRLQLRVHSSYLAAR